MSSIRRLGFSWTTAFSVLSTGDGTFIPLTGWMPSADVGKARSTWEAHSEAAANMITRPGYQTANVENSPDTAVALGSDSQSSNGMKYGTAMTDISSVTQAKGLVRFGIWVKLASGSTLACVRVMGSFDIQAP